MKLSLGFILILYQHILTMTILGANTLNRIDDEPREGIKASHNGLLTSPNQRAAEWACAFAPYILSPAVYALIQSPLCASLRRQDAHLCIPLTVIILIPLASHVCIFVRCYRKHGERMPQHEGAGVGNRENKLLLLKQEIKREAEMPCSSTSW